MSEENVYIRTPLTKWQEKNKRIEELEERVRQLEEALRFVQAKQPEALKIIEQNGFVFDKIGKEPGNWQHLAFTLYSNLCEIENLAANALKAPE